MSRMRDGLAMCWFPFQRTAYTSPLLFWDALRAPWAQSWPSNICMCPAPSTHLFAMQSVSLYVFRICTVALLSVQSLLCKSRFQSLILATTRALVCRHEEYELTASMVMEAESVASASQVHLPPPSLHCIKSITYRSCSQFAMPLTSFVLGNAACRAFGHLGQAVPAWHACTDVHADRGQA